jgi:hypothetical protein
MGPTEATGLNEAFVVGVADDFAVTGSFEASGALAIEAGVSSEDPMMPRLPRERVEVEPELGWDETKWCDLCGRWLNGPEQYEEHIWKPKHRGLVKKAKTYAGENCEQSPFPISL